MRINWVLPSIDEKGIKSIELPESTTQIVIGSLRFAAVKALTSSGNLASDAVIVLKAMKDLSFMPSCVYSPLSSFEGARRRNASSSFAVAPASPEGSPEVILPPKGMIASLLAGPEDLLEET